MANKKNFHSTKTYIILGSLLILIPSVVGGIFSLIFKYLLYLEVTYVVFGLLVLLAIPIRLRMRDSQNLKKTKSISEDKTTDEYKVWLKEQYLIAIFGVIDLLLSLLVFLISTLI